MLGGCLSLGSGILRPVCRQLLISFITHTHPFNSPLSRTTRVSRYQKGKPIWILMKQETVSGSGISWAICKSAPRSRQITMPAPHQSQPDALPATKPTASNKSNRIPYQMFTVISVPWNGECDICQYCKV